MDVGQLLCEPLVRLDNRSTSLKREEIVCVCCVRNEFLRLPFFIDYYRKLGVDRFYFIDNVSTDGTTDFLLNQPDSHVYSATGRYSDSHCGVRWINQILDANAQDHWALTVDADELIVYPDCEEIGLAALAQRIEKEGAGCLQAFLLDFYSDLPIRETTYRRGADFRTACPFFDTDTYHEFGPRGLPRRGGPRHRLFWSGRSNPKPSPYLEKFPFAKWGPAVRYEASTHIISGSRASGKTGALQHFKFFSSFFEQAAEEAARGEHWDGAWEYRTYWNVLRAEPSLSAYHPGSARYRDSRQLVDQGLMLAKTPAMARGQS